ncbi:hypothetical protein SAMN05444487_10219 [Marininema mesophilum]|uniref:DNA alkylation repair protein n=1 Tax=Marininema mesophilum TaxID=1048340 RepID=A0A1H2RUK3_9BACL|nr:DNA alkylation repair protein [Marininema mesophilum]SDW23146.1 hypothetical protein SAMN05444487_10219 [Marininema mesophilum]
MDSNYLCPVCGTNRSRFNLIEQVVTPVRKDPNNGAILEQVATNDPLHVPYRGESLRVQCGVCGVVEAEERFIKTAQREPQKLTRNTSS